MTYVPTFASLFTGCGGFDLGFVSKGFRHLGGYDSDPDAVENFRENVKGSIHQVDLTQGIPNQENLSELDVLIAGPPCQGFSTAGKRVLDDSRNHLLTLTGKLAKSVSPKVLVVENVAGALSGEHAKFHQSLDAMMREAGYRTYTAKFQAADLGMSQLRRRMLFFAWRTDRDVNFQLTPKPPGKLSAVIRGASNAKNHSPVLLDPNSREILIAKKIKQGQKLSNVRGGVNSIATWDIPEVFGAISDNERTVLEMLRRLRRQNRKRDYGDADPVCQRRLEEALGDPFNRLVEGLIQKGYLRRVESGIDLVGTFNGKYRRLAWDKPSFTVDTRFGSPTYFLHPSKNRGFTVREAARIQGFKDSYVFKGSEKSQYRLIGNAVPPPLGAFAAEKVLRLLGKDR